MTVTIAVPFIYEGFFLPESPRDLLLMDLEAAPVDIREGGVDLLVEIDEVSTVEREVEEEEGEPSTLLMDRAEGRLILATEKAKNQTAAQATMQLEADYYSYVEPYLSSSFQPQELKGI